MSAETSDKEAWVPKDGYLFKKSRSGAWQRRYFQIQHQYLIYSKNDRTTNKVLACLNMSAVGDIQLVSPENEPDKYDGDLICLLSFP